MVRWATGDRTRAKGLTLPELVLVLALVGLTAAIAYPPLARARARIDVRAAADLFAATHRLTRQVAVQYGRLARLHIDPSAGAYWLTVDTSAMPRRAVEDTIGPVVRTGSRFGGVRLESYRRLLCFDPRGLGTAAGTCELPNARLVFERAGVAETLTVSTAGGLRRR